MKNKLLEYREGLTVQHAEALKQAYLLEGALLFIEQFLADIEEGEQSPSVEEGDHES